MHVRPPLTRISLPLDKHGVVQIELDENLFSFVVAIERSEYLHHTYTE